MEVPGAVHLVKVGLGEEKLRLATEVDITLSPAAVATSTAPAAATTVTTTTAVTAATGTTGTAARALRRGRGAATAHCGHVSGCTSSERGSRWGPAYSCSSSSCCSRAPANEGSGDGTAGRSCASTSLRGKISAAKERSDRSELRPVYAKCTQRNWMRRRMARRGKGGKGEEAREEGVKW